MSIVNKLKAIADIITPPAGYKTLFFRSDTGVPAVKDENGVVSDLVIPGDASGVTFEPADVLNWTDSVDPGNVDDALDDLALRVNTLETAEAPDAAIVTFTPSDATDWNGDVDPGDVQEALDQLADRVTTNEGAIGTNNFGIVAVAGQSNVAADAIGDTLTLAGAGLAVITTDAGTDTVTITVSVPDASVVPFTPSNSMNWTDSEDPGDVDDALNDLAARLQGIEETESVFRNVAVSGQDTIIADGSNDTLTFAAGSNITITTNASTDTITIASSGGGSGGLTLLEQHTASSSATLDFTTRNAAGQSGATFQSDFDEYMVELVNVIPATSNVLPRILVSTNGGSSYITAAASYAWSSSTWNRFGVAASGNDSDTQYTLTHNNLSNSSEYGLCTSLKVFNPASASLRTQFNGVGSYFENSGVFSGQSTFGMHLSAAAVNAFRVLMSSGNIASGTIRVYGVAK